MDWAPAQTAMVQDIYTGYGCVCNVSGKITHFHQRRENVEWAGRGYSIKNLKYVYQGREFHKKILCQGQTLERSRAGGFR